MAAETPPGPAAVPKPLLSLCPPPGPWEPCSSQGGDRLFSTGTCPTRNSHTSSSSAPELHSTLALSRSTSLCPQDSPAGEAPPACADAAKGSLATRSLSPEPLGTGMAQSSWVSPACVGPPVLTLEEPDRVTDSCAGEAGPPPRLTGLLSPSMRTGPLAAQPWARLRPDTLGEGSLGPRGLPRTCRGGCPERCSGRAKCPPNKALLPFLHGLLGAKCHPQLLINMRDCARHGCKGQLPPVGHSLAPAPLAPVVGAPGHLPRVSHLRIQKTPLQTH